MSLLLSIPVNNDSVDSEWKNFPLRLLWSGKVREVYEIDKDRILIITTDRLSAFDVIMKNVINT